MTKRTVKAIIFDMDGVILDSEPFHKRAREIMFQKYSIVPDENFPEAVGRSSVEFWQAVIDLKGMNNDAVKLTREQFDLVEQQIRENHTPASDGLRDVLVWAKEKGVKIALASASDDILVTNSLKLTGVYDYFDHLVTSSDITKVKPDPESYLKAMQKAGVTADEAVAVEDSKSGVQSAKSAGLYCFGYSNPTSGGQDISRADIIIDNIGKVLEYIDAK